MPKKKVVRPVKEDEVKGYTNTEDYLIEPAEEKPLETDAELTAEVKAEVFKEEPEVIETKPSDMVKVKVIFGSVGVDDMGFFEVGDEFTLSRERAEIIDKKFIQIIE